MRYLIMILIMTYTLGCAVMPVTVVDKKHRCELSSDKKTLKIVDVASETNTYYSVSGLLLTPIILPTTAVLSTSYMVVNNLYHLAEEKIKCE